VDRWKNQEKEKMHVMMTLQRWWWRRRARMQSLFIAIHPTKGNLPPVLLGEGGVLDLLLHHLHSFNRQYSGSLLHL
jgi:hypothetical protein